MKDEALFKEALARLPHGPEFRYVDRLTELEPGVSGLGEFTLRGDAAFLKGHFPGQPLMPGVLLIEAAAQVAGVVAQSDPEIPPLRNLKLTAVRSAKILGTAEPGETIRVEASVDGRMGHLIQVSAVVTVGGRAILRTMLTLAGE